MRRNHEQHQIMRTVIKEVIENDGNPTMPTMVGHHRGGEKRYVCVKDGGDIFSIPESSSVCSSFSMQQNKNHTQKQDKYNNFSNKQTKSSMDRTPRRLGRKMRNDALRSLAGILAEARVHDSTLKEAIDAIMSTVSPSYSPPNNEVVSRTRKKHRKSRDCLRTRSVDDAVPSSVRAVSSMYSSTDDASETETETDTDTMTETEKHERQQAAIAALAAAREKARLRNKIAGEACLRLYNQAKGRIGWNMNMNANVNVNVNPTILVSFPMHVHETKSVGTAKTVLTQDLSCSSPIHPWHEFESRNADDECGREGNFKERRTMEGCNRTYDRDTGRRISKEKEQEQEQEEGEGKEHQEVPYDLVSLQDVEEIEIVPRHLHRGIKAHVYLYNTSKPKQTEGKKRREDIAIAISKAKELPNFDEWPKLPMNEADSLYRRSMKYFIGRELSRAKLAKDLDLEYVSRFKFLM